MSDVAYAPQTAASLSLVPPTTVITQAVRYGRMDETPFLSALRGALLAYSSRTDEDVERLRSLQAERLRPYEAFVGSTSAASIEMLVDPEHDESLLDLLMDERAALETLPDALSRSVWTFRKRIVAKYFRLPDRPDGKHETVYLPPLEKGFPRSALHLVTLVRPLVSFEPFDLVYSAPDDRAFIEGIVHAASEYPAYERSMRRLFPPVRSEKDLPALGKAVNAYVAARRSWAFSV